MIVWHRGQMPTGRSRLVTFNSALFDIKEPRPESGLSSLIYPDSSIVRKTACHRAILGFVMGHDLRRLFVSR
jgi:hypothetical protein